MKFSGNIVEFGRNLYRRVISSIAFYPTIVTVIFLFLSLLLTSSFGERISLYFVKWAPNFSISDLDIAETILSTLIGGILSLTVFSFSMVMVVLNQASSNFSPRLLPGLISDKKHQLILGFYAGTLLYSLVVMINMGTSENRVAAIGLSSMLAAIFGVFCVILFVYFIHNISRAIQIDNIIDTTYHKSNLLLDQQLKNQEEAKPQGKYWKVFNSRETGYFRGVKTSFQLSSKIPEALTIELLPYLDQHVWKEAPLFKVSEEIGETTVDEIYEGLSFAPDRHEGDNYLGGMIKLMEVAVKSMSPGINDPGTAIDSLVKLGELLNKALQVFDRTWFRKESDKVSIILNNAQAPELFRLLIQPIRYYSGEDASVLYVLINCLKSIRRRHSGSELTVEMIKEELEAIQNMVEKSFASDKDKEAVLAELKA